MDGAPGGSKRPESTPPDDVEGRDSLPAADERVRRRLARLAWLLDSSIPLPFGFRIGLDGLIGLVPGGGDAAAAALSFYIVVQAARLGVPASVLAHMTFNVVLELVVGAVPVVGDLFDFAYKANQRNVALIDAHLHAPRPTRNRSRVLVALTLLIALTITVGAAVAMIALASALLEAVAA